MGITRECLDEDDLCHCVKKSFTQTSMDKVVDCLQKIHAKESSGGRSFGPCTCCLDGDGELVQACLIERREPYCLVVYKIYQGFSWI